MKVVALPAVALLTKLTEPGRQPPYNDGISKVCVMPELLLIAWLMTNALTPVLSCKRWHRD
jgi:hypothetical protein